MSNVIGPWPGNAELEGRENYPTDEAVAEENDELRAEEGIAPDDAKRDDASEKHHHRHRS